MSGADGAGRDWAAFTSVTALEAALRQASYDRFTGRLAAIGGAGTAGSEICLVGGLVTAMITSASPGPDSLLLKSGRVGQSDWSRAVDTVGESGRLDRTLVERALVGSGELDVIRAAALFDAMFAVFLDAPEGWEARPAGGAAAGGAGAGANGGPRASAEALDERSEVEADADTGSAAADSPPGVEPPLPLLPGVSPAILLAEAGRRCAALTRRWGSPADLARSRPQVTAKAAHTGAGVIQRHREILLCANGRRTPRDIAFVLGRGVYAVMIDIGRLEKGGLLQTKDQAVPAALPSVAPRRVDPDAAASPAPARPLPPPRHLPQRSARQPARAEGMTPYPSFDRAHAERPRRRAPDEQTAPGDTAGPPRTGPGDDAPGVAPPRT